MSAGLILHDLGAPHGGAPWRDALRAGGWDDWIAPDLPGHGTTPAPRTGAYDPMAVVTLARRATPATPATVVGIGENAHAALVLAAGSGCDAVVVVDGLHGAFRSATDEVARMYATIRGIADAPDATAPPPITGRDPRTTFGYGITVSAAFLRRFWAAVTVPVLAIETPASSTPPDERAERLAWFGGPARLTVVGAAAPDAVLAAIEGLAGQG